MAGTGIQSDPYLVSTWAELVEKANENDKYIKIENDIDVLLEYPDGDAPTLVLNSYVDGDNHTISRWYCTGSRYLIYTNESCHYIKNCIFTNIKTGHSLCSIEVPSGSESYVVIDNCKFAGVMGDGSIFTPRQNSNYRNGTIRNVTINIKGGNLVLLYVAYGPDYLHYYNLNVKLISNAESLIYSRYSSRHLFFNDSQLELHMPNLTGFVNSGCYCSFDNSVLDVYNETHDIAFNSENSAVSIFNQTHAPATTGTANKFVGVDNTHWLDAAYLADTVGFNIVTGD